MGVSEKTINAERGLNIRANLYIIRYFWKRLKGKGDDVGYIYNLFDISRQRYSRIILGDPFFMPPETVKNICGTFAIEETYMTPKGKIIAVPGLTDKDWKNGLQTLALEEANKKRKEDDKYEPPITREEEYACKKIKKVLNEQATPGYIEEHYNSKDPLFRICYYFLRGAAYQEGAYVKQLMDQLGCLDVQEWKRMEQDKETLERYRKALFKHLEYINALLVIGKYTGQ